MSKSPIITRPNPMKETVITKEAMVRSLLGSIEKFEKELEEITVSIAASVEDSANSVPMDEDGDPVPKGILYANMMISLFDSGAQSHHALSNLARIQRAVFLRKEMRELTATLMTVMSAPEDTRFLMDTEALLRVGL